MEDYKKAGAKQIAEGCRTLVTIAAMSVILKFFHDIDGPWFGLATFPYLFFMFSIPICWLHSFTCICDGLETYLGDIPLSGGFKLAIGLTMIGMLVTFYFTKVM